MDLKQLESIIASRLNELGYELISLSFKYENKEHVLSLIIDRVEPIDLNAIGEVSNEINALLDECDPFEQAYLLDISSLGAEKPLKMDQLNNYLHQYIHVHLINPINGENIYEGDLLEVDEDKIVLSYRIKTRTKTVDILKSNISKIRLAIKF